MKRGAARLRKIRSDLPAAGAQDLGERLRAAGAAVEGDRFRVGDRDFGDEEQAADAAFGGDGEVGEDDEVVDAQNPSDIQRKRLEQDRQRTEALKHQLELQNQEKK